MRLAPCLLVAALALGLVASRGGAHAIVRHAAPADGETVADPRQISLTFNSRIEQRFSSMVLEGPGSLRRPLGRVASLATANKLVCALPPLEPGRYRVRWRVLAADGHITEGSLGFTVSPGTSGRRGGVS
jgi:methionine-rich copper-binding protein CopC